MQLYPLKKEDSLTKINYDQNQGGSKPAHLQT